MATLCVNIDHIATLRQARKGIEPEPVHAAGIVEMAGSTGVTVHLREDERHIQERDVRLIRQIVQGHLNLEMAATHAMADKALALCPGVVTLVPERREEVTTEGGLDVHGRLSEVREVTRRLREAGISVSLFIDPETTQIESTRRCGADQVEFHTGQYSLHQGEAQRDQLLKLYAAAEFAQRQGLLVNAGHGLNYHNVLPVAAIPGMCELNIGHSIISRSVFDGLRAAVESMAALIACATHHPEAYRPSGR